MRSAFCNGFSTHAGLSLLTRLTRRHFGSRQGPKCVWTLFAASTGYTIKWCLWIHLEKWMAFWYYTSREMFLETIKNSKFSSSSRSFLSFFTACLVVYGIKRKQNYCPLMCFKLYKNIFLVVRAISLVIKELDRIGRARRCRESDNNLQNTDTFHTLFNRPIGYFFMPKLYKRKDDK